MGHSNANFTNQIYVENEMIIAGSTEKIQSYIDSLLPKTETFDLATPLDSYIKQCIPGCHTIE